MNKECKTCKKIHTEVPQDARPDFQQDVLVAWVWECSCESTLYAYKFDFETLKDFMKEGII